MACASQPPPPPAKPQPPRAPTTIFALSDDLLRQIFLRLPSLPSLVRAALTCPTFLAAVRSSPAFRRHFCAVHPPPLLGFFFDSDGTKVSCFTPLRRSSDPDLAAAVRGADVFLTRVPCHDDACPGWQIMACQDGRLLLRNGSNPQITTYDPLTGALNFLPTPPDKISHGHRGKFIPMTTEFLLSSDDETLDQSSFSVVTCCHDKSRVRVAIFSSATKEWRILPWSEPMPLQPASGKYWLLAGTLVNGFICWSHVKHAYMVVLDTSTWRFSCIDLPEVLKGQGHLYRTGGTKDGKLCIVAAFGFMLVIWLRKIDAADGVEKWIIDTYIQLEEEVLLATQGTRDDHGSLKVLGILDGIVYLSTFETFRDASLPCWYLSFCLEKRKLEKLIYTKTDGYFHPYIMPWPTSLVRSNLSALH